jgi:hypothetical protein
MPRLFNSAKHTLFVLFILIAWPLRARLEDRINKSIFKLFFVIFLAFFAGGGNAVAGKLLWDPFSSEHMDGSKWWPREYVHQVVNEQYISKLGNSSGMGAEVLPGIFRVSLPLVESNEINAIQTDITLVEVIRDQQAVDAKSFAMVGGYFYNVSEIQGLAGDIFAQINIGDQGNGLEAFWEVSKRVSADSSQWEILGSGTIPLETPLQIGTPANVKISHDDNKTIEFTVNGKTAVFVGTEEKKRGPEESFKALRVGIDATDGSNSGFISAKFDTVYINNSQTLYDDFSDPTIDLSKWQYSEWVREISNGRLQSVLKRSDSNGQVNTYLSPEDAPYLEAKVRIDSDTQLSGEASCIARIQGYFYNDSRGPGSGTEHNKNEGDIFAQVKLTYRSDGTLNATATVERSEKADQSDFSYLFYEKFRTPISLDRDYILSINFEDQKLIFSCDGETKVYEIKTLIYPPYGEHRLLRSRLYLGSGETGYLKTQFDDVYIGYPSGDINFDKTAGVLDAILGLRALTGQKTLETIYIEADLNKDDKIGVEETLYSLQIGSAVRRPEFPFKGYIGVTIQHGYPDSYALAVSTSLPFSSSLATGPNINNVWQAHETHSLVNLSARPTAGDIYGITVLYEDGSSQEKEFVVETINDNFSFIQYPENNDIIFTPTPEFTWSETTGIVSSLIMVAEINNGQEQNWIWDATVSPDTDSAIYNFDGSATASLSPGKTYQVILHTYNDIGHQATTGSTFSVSVP